MRASKHDGAAAPRASALRNDEARGVAGFALGGCKRDRNDANSTRTRRDDLALLACRCRAHRPPCATCRRWAAILAAVTLRRAARGVA